MAGSEFGGTGFLVGLPSRFENRLHVYVVTNHHVACTGGSSVVRVTTRDGGSDVFPFDPSEWDFDPRYDVAVCALPLDEARHRFSYLIPDMLRSKENMGQERIDVGEDVCMVGRFVDHDGGPINRPALRFGHISVMPFPIEQPNGRMADSYCIDLHSRSGYSGSPVFVYRTPGFDLEARRAEDVKDMGFLVNGVVHFSLLGIHFAQFPEQWEIGMDAKEKHKECSSVPFIPEGSYIKGLSGMTCVLPAWIILEVLSMPKLIRARELADEQETLRRARYGSPPLAE